MADNEKTRLQPKYFNILKLRIRWVLLDAEMETVVILKML